MRLRLRGWALTALAALTLAGACGGGGGTAADAGAQSDGNADVALDSAGDAPVGAIDCAASCDRIAAICAGVSNIDANWLSICRQNCEVRAAVMPETAQAEVACTSQAPDCTTAILCSVSPTGGRG